MIQLILTIIRQYRNIDMEAAASLIGQGLGREVCLQPIAGGNCLHDTAEGNGIVRCSQGIGIMEVDLILTRTFLVVGGFRLYAHFGEGQADFPADIFTLVLWSHIQIASMIIHLTGGGIGLTGLEQIKLQLGAKVKVETCSFSILDCSGQDGAGIALKHGAIRMRHCAEHADDLTVF